MRNFKDDLRFSQDPKHHEFWARHYQRFFPNMMFTLVNDGDNEAQRRGVDRLIYLGNDKFLRIDEKLDTHATNNYFLEFISVDKSSAPGWIAKDLAADYVAYGFINHDVCDWLPCASLQFAWRIHGEEWKLKYGVKEIGNGTYKTAGVAVPRKVVWAAISEGLYLGK